MRSRLIEEARSYLNEEDRPIEEAKTSVSCSQCKYYAKLEKAMHEKHGCLAYRNIKKEYGIISDLDFEITNSETNDKNLIGKSCLRGTKPWSTFIRRKKGSECKFFLKKVTEEELKKNDTVTMGETHYIVQAVLDNGEVEVTDAKGKRKSFPIGSLKLASTPMIFGKLKEESAKLIQEGIDSDIKQAIKDTHSPEVKRFADKLDDFRYESSVLDGDKYGGEKKNFILISNYTGGTSSDFTTYYFPKKEVIEQSVDTPPKYLLYKRFANVKYRVGRYGELKNIKGSMSIVDAIKELDGAYASYSKGLANYVKSTGDYS